MLFLLLLRVFLHGQTQTHGTWSTQLDQGQLDPFGIKLNPRSLWLVEEDPYTWPYWEWDKKPWIHFTEESTAAAPLKLPWAHSASSNTDSCPPVRYFTKGAISFEKSQRLGNYPGGLGFLMFHCCKFTWSTSNPGCETGGPWQWLWVSVPVPMLGWKSHGWEQGSYFRLHQTML